MESYKNLIILIIVSFNFLLASPLVFSQNREPATRNTAEKIYRLTLDEATRLAIENNFEVQLVQYDAQIAKTKQGEAESIYDTLLEAEIKYRDNQNARTTTLSGTKNLENDYNVGVSKKLPTGTTLEMDMTNARDWSNSLFATINPSHDSALGVVVHQDLGRNFLGTQDRGNIKITKLDIENSQYTSVEKIEAKVADVQKAYWDLALHLERVKVEERMTEQAKKLYDLHSEKIKSGLVEAPELLASEANYRKRMNNLSLAQNQAQTKANILKLLLNLDAAVEILPAESLSANEAVEDFNRSLQKAFANRQDYKRAQNDIAAKDIKISMAKNALWPEINLEASFVRNGIGDHFNDAVKNITQQDNPEKFIGVSINFPLENHQAKSQWSSAKIEKAKALVNFKLTERQITTGIIDQVRTCNVLQEIAGNSAAIAKLQAQKLEEEEKRFSRGRSDTDTMIRFQEDVIKAQAEALQDQFNYLTAKIDLRVKESTVLNGYWKENY